MTTTEIETNKATTTVLQMVCAKVRACAKTADGSARPAAILWTDPTSEWKPAIEMLKQSMPELIELGKYEPALRRGPAIWIRCIVDRTLPLDGADQSLPPIVYLPGVARQELRAGEDCPATLRPLVELLYRGTAWMHQGGHDYKVSAFLKSPAVLGLDVAEDSQTKRALLNAVREVLGSTIASLKGRRLEAVDFNKLLSKDINRDLLKWLGNSEGTQQAMSQEQWQAFVQTIKSDFQFDPKEDGVLTAAERLCQGDGAWADAWRRFEEAPDVFPGLLDVLGRVEPAGGLFAGKDTSRYVRANDEAEEALDVALGELQGLPHKQACEAVIDLEDKHGMRRNTVWAKLNRTRFANALKHLAILARGASKPIGGVSPKDFVEAYESTGWRTDLAMLDAVALIEGAKDESVLEVVRQLAEPWMGDGAMAFQTAVNSYPLQNASAVTGVAAEEGCCVLFVDGLRYDLGRLVAEALEEAGCGVKMGWRWAALPTVTATAKPAVTPVADKITGGKLDVTFAPHFKESKKIADASGLRAAITAAGGQVIGPGEFAVARDGAIGGWQEAGEIDSLGHNLKARLAGQVRTEVRKVAETVRSLLESGWKCVRVVTDHGWLLMPGGLPKVELSKHLVATKWARCAVLNGSPDSGVVLACWHWNASSSVATAPGIACFTAKQEYAHGGISIQECLIPDFVVTPGSVGVGTSKAVITSVAWANFRCVLETRDSNSEMSIDVRLETANGKSVLKKTRSLEPDGSVNIPIEDDYENKKLVVVLLASNGEIISQRTTRIGDKI